MRRTVLAVVVALFVAPAWASSPGEPLDCSDWVFLEPGYWCEPFVPFPCAFDDLFCENLPWMGLPSDNEFYFYELRVVHDVVPPCQTGGIGLDEVRLIRIDSQRNETVIGYLRERCNGLQRDRSETCTGISQPFPACLHFDPPSGRMLVKTQNLATEGDIWGKQVFAISGFASLFDVLQTFAPLTSTFGFRVPYMPEGFQYAEWFDTYYGTLSTVGDWSQLQSLQCGYPASPPSVGDYLTVADPAPTPSPGQGYYYVTAANYMGDKRYGRQRANGVLTGRDPAVLPGCTD